MIPEIFTVFAEQREQVPVGRAMVDVELMYECYPQHMHMGTSNK